MLWVAGLLVKVALDDKFQWTRLVREACSVYLGRICQRLIASFAILLVLLPLELFFLLHFVGWFQTGGLPVGGFME